MGASGWLQRALLQSVGSISWPDGVLNAGRPVYGAHTLTARHPLHPPPTNTDRRPT